MYTYVPLLSLICMHSNFIRLTHLEHQSHCEFQTWTCLANVLTTATSSDPTPLSIGHACTSTVSLQGVTSVTGVGHCGSKSCTRDTSMTICRSIGGWTTADGCRESKGTTFPGATMQAHAIQCKQIHIIYIQNHTQMYGHMRESYTPIYTGIVHVNTCLYLHVLQSSVSILPFSL